MPQFPTLVDHSLNEVDVNSPIRQAYPRDFYPSPQTVQFPQGKTTFWLLGPAEGIKVALVHGISTPCLIWRNVAPYLAENGFRVLVYDLYGRGYSEAPHTVYNHDLYTTQLALLLQHIRWETAHLVGLSMGGGIVGAFGALFPNLVTEKIVFLAAAGLIQGPPKTTTVPADTDPELAADSSNIMKSMPKLQRERLPGFARAFESSIRDGPIRGLDNAFKMVAENSRLKCCVIHGTSDQTVPFSAGERIKETITAAKMVPIEGADHDLIISPKYYDQVRKGILAFLRE